MVESKPRVPAAASAAGAGVPVRPVAVGAKTVARRASTTVRPPAAWVTE